MVDSPHVCDILSVERIGSARQYLGVLRAWLGRGAGEPGFEGLEGLCARGWRAVGRAVIRGATGAGGAGARHAFAQCQPSWSTP